VLKFAHVLPVAFFAELDAKALADDSHFGILAEQVRLMRARDRKTLAKALQKIYLVVC
jgi:hypothetical protein